MQIAQVSLKSPVLCTSLPAFHFTTRVLPVILSKTRYHFRLSSHNEHFIFSLTLMMKPNHLFPSYPTAPLTPPQT